MKIYLCNENCHVDWRRGFYPKRKDLFLASIPEGPYCYGKGRGDKCPHWKLIYGMPYQMNGYCKFLNKGDWYPSEKGGTSLLWDQCKECGVNDYF